jgi:Crinkler effector protein N-terminal domain
MWRVVKAWESEVALSSTTTNMSGSREIKVFCLILGDNSPFPVKIAESDTIGDLKDNIKEKNPETLKGVEAHKLVLWMVRVSLTDECHSLMRISGRCLFPQRLWRNYLHTFSGQRTSKVSKALRN